MAIDPLEPLDDTSWLAVKGGTVEAVVRVLRLSGPRPETWARGIAIASGDFDGSPADWPELAGVFITPLLRGWRLAVGGYLGAGPAVHNPDDHRTGWRRVAGWCRRLSREFAECYAFTDQAQLDWYSWIMARDGNVVRQVVYEDGEYLSRRGVPSGVEARLAAQFRPDELRPRWVPDVGDVPRIDGGVSVNPWRVRPRTRTLGQGVVAVTPWGRQQGVAFAAPG